MANEEIPPGIPYFHCDLSNSGFPMYCTCILQIWVLINSINTSMEINLVGTQH